MTIVIPTKTRLVSYQLGLNFNSLRILRVPL